LASAGDVDILNDKTKNLCLHLAEPNLSYITNEYNKLASCVDLKERMVAYPETDLSRALSVSKHPAFDRRVHSFPAFSTRRGSGSFLALSVSLVEKPLEIDTPNRSAWKIT
jgi:hypothetical protein